MPDTMSPETVLLIEILAKTDAIFGKWPNPIESVESNRCCSAIFHAQEAHGRGEGIDWVVGGTTAERLDGMNRLGTLKQKGLVRIFKPAGNRRRVALTYRGDDVARGLIGHTRAADAWPLLQGIAQAVDGCRGVGPTGIWIIEEQLVVAYGEEFEVVRGLILPLLVRGLLASTVDTTSEERFTTTPKGKTAAAGPAPVPADTVEEDPKATELHWAAYDRFTREREAWRAPVNETFIPHPARK